MEMLHRISFGNDLYQSGKQNKVLVPVRELESYDGVKIFKTRLENGQWSVEIVEVRLLSFGYPHDSIRLVPGLTFDTFNDIRDPSDVIKYTLDNEPSLLKKSGEEMVHIMGAGAEKGLNVRDTRPNDADSRPIIKQIGPGSHSIKFNLGHVSHIGNANDIADCDVLQTGSYSSDKILPAFTIIDPQQNEKVILTSGARAVHDRVFNDLSAKIWKCTIRGVAQQSTQFLRVVYDHTLKTNSEYDIGTVKHLQRDEVWLEVEDGQPVVRVRETKYLDIDNYQVLNYQGLHLLMPELSSEWKSGTQIIENYQKISDTVIQRELMRDIEYLDDLPQSLSITSSSNIIITIDTRWQKTFGNAGMTLTCQEDLSRKFTLPGLETKLRINTEEGNIFETFFKQISTHFWICTDQTNGNDIVRVHHQFLVKHDMLYRIEEICYFYGVTIFAGILKEQTESHTTYEIIVIKYHENGANYPIVKYDGKLTFKDGSILPLQASGLNELYGVRDVLYPSDFKVVYRKQISQIGYSIQILLFFAGYAESPMDEQELIINCKAFDIGKVSRDGIRPMIMWNRNTDGNGSPTRSLMTQQQLDQCFDQHFDIQICGMVLLDLFLLQTMREHFER
ncbi:uncharacterized protein LOC120349760 isoform X2 [Nilaparvata lugens]|uniref:uncharacterized protein LOC120349760 isoform X2 n=1 Tax=Nilaparvata lugens TaxID=108931 RepID=UPI00193D0AD4|nr:uncharacterized protein LOC120349760 isoform X2 [Nilaparvata lugens]